MITFMSGPAAGAGLALRRAPMFLRVVIDETDGKVDALDLLDDTPGPSEKIRVYQLAAPSSMAHVCYRGRDRDRSGWYAVGIYRHVDDVDGEMVRETGRWRAWVDERCAADPELAAMPLEP